MVWIGQLGGLFGTISAKAGAGRKALAVISASYLLSCQIDRLRQFATTTASPDEDRPQ